MSKDNQSSDIDKVTNIVEYNTNEGVKISYVVDKLSTIHHMSPAKARHIVRDALDKGRVRTDRKFRLHLARPD